MSVLPWLVRRSRLVCNQQNLVSSSTTTVSNTSLDQAFFGFCTATGGIWALRGLSPTLGSNVFVAPSSSVIGKVIIGSNSSIWYNCVLRGDVNEIRIGEETNIQDGSVIHVARNNSKGVALPTVIGNKVTVGHMALLHACTLEDLSFVGMAAVVMDGAVLKTGKVISKSIHALCAFLTDSCVMQVRWLLLVVWSLQVK